MTYHDTRRRYGAVSLLFHWAMALLIIAQFMALGGYINDGEHWIGNTIVPWHVDIGLLLLVLVSLRVLWMLGQREHRPELRGRHAMQLMAKGGHLLLYVCMILMPVTGILIMVGEGHSLGFFGLQLLAERETEMSWAIMLGESHAPISWLFVALVLGHLGAALYHHFVKHDDTLQRMTARSSLRSPNNGTK
ncbi:cytochrome b [Halomonas piscis]|uniref:Cytochrome b n=2 Tax=Halomonas TaxID=2745 RepID=A0ABY9YZL1_9GAMM|nr:cytochrome b [Halomonas piscis]WNK20311.1 cytochrome b [Halomonas piscis]